MAKADGDEKISPAFTEIYRLLHQGFVDEKLVVPSSVLLVERRCDCERFEWRPVYGPP